MSDMEKARIIAEKVMGWERVDTIHVIDKDGQHTWHWAKDGKYVESRYYDPANNVAQAIEALQKYVMDQEIGFELSRPGRYIDTGEIYKEWRPYGHVVVDIGGHRAIVDDNDPDPNAMAVAILDVLLAALRL